MQPCCPHRHSGPFGSIEIWPTSPAVPRAPRHSSPSATMPAAMPVPRLRYAIERDPCAPTDRRAKAPNAAAFTSFSTRTGTPSAGSTAAARSSSSTPRFTACTTRAVPGSTCPGMPMPTESIGLVDLVTEQAHRLQDRPHDGIRSPAGRQTHARDDRARRSRRRRHPSSCLRCRARPSSPGLPAGGGVGAARASALDRPCDESAGHATLDDQEEDDHRDRDQGGAGHDRAPVDRARRPRTTGTRSARSAGSGCSPSSAAAPS